MDAKLAKYSVYIMLHVIFCNIELVIMDKIISILISIS